MLNNKKITVTFILFLAVIFLLPHLASAQAEIGINDLINQGANLIKTDLRTMIANIINVFLGFLGVVAVLIVMYGGFKWMTSAGVPQKIDEAKRILINGAIGVGIVLAAYGLTYFIFQVLTGTPWSGNPGGSGGPGSGYSGGVGLGGGALESHYPARNAQDVPRNTMIYVTFKEPIDVAGIVNDVGACTAASGVNCVSNINIRLFDTRTSVALNNTDLLVTYNPVERKTFEFNPFGSTATNLGESSGNVRYQMVLKSLMTETGHQTFPLTTHYDWYFTVSNVTDEIPPTVSSVLPADGTTDNPPNSTVQIIFSEAVIPSGTYGASGKYNGAPGDFTNIKINEGATILNGEYLISNQYRTVEFITDEFCGENSCGGDIFCLPKNKVLSGLIGGVIKDMAGNFLNAPTPGVNGVDYPWSFTTGNAVDLSEPVVSSMQPPPANSVPLDDPLRIKFTKDLLSSSVNSSNIKFYEVIPDDKNFWMSMPDSKTININHDRLTPLTDYFPVMTGSIKDRWQNCWFPCACDDPANGTCKCKPAADPSANCAAGTHCETIIP